MKKFILSLLMLCSVGCKTVYVIVEGEGVAVDVTVSGSEVDNVLDFP